MHQEMQPHVKAKITGRLSTQRHERTQTALSQPHCSTNPCHETCLRNNQPQRSQAKQKAYSLLFYLLCLFCSLMAPLIESNLNGCSPWVHAHAKPAPSPPYKHQALNRLPKTQTLLLRYSSQVQQTSKPNIKISQNMFPPNLHHADRTHTRKQTGSNSLVILYSPTSRKHETNPRQKATPRQV